MPWLTGDEVPTTFKCREVRIPDNPAFVSALNGAVLELTYPHNWEQFGTLTPQEMAAAFLDVYFALQDDQCVEPQTVIYPASFEINPLSARVFGGGVPTFTVNTTVVNGLYAEQLPAALGTQLVYPFYCRAGTYDMMLIGLRSTIYAQTKYYLDDVDLVTAHDWYNAATQTNFQQTFSMVVPADGWHKLRIHAYAKNVSSSAYNVRISSILGRIAGLLP